MPVQLTITRPSSDFTSRDFDAWILDLRSKVAAAFPAWTDFTTANFGNILLEMFAHSLDVGSFYQDQQFLETRVIFARLLSSMIALGKNLGFVLPGSTVATADLEITYANGLPRTADLTVPKGTVVQTANGVAQFATISDAVIPSGQIQVTPVGSQNAFVASDSFVAPGTASFAFTLSATPYVDGSSSVTIASQSWAAASDFFSSGPTDKVYVVTVDANRRATAVFGDGVNGAIPSGIGTVTYLTGGGSSGNVDADTLSIFRDGSSFSTTKGEVCVLVVRNPSKASGGVDPMGVEGARVAIPAFVRTAGKRSVTHQDFEDNALKVRGVARAMILTADDSNSVPENTGWLYIAPVGGGLPTLSLRNQVLAFILASYPPTLTFTLLMKLQTLQTFAVSAHVSLNRNVAQADARTATVAALTNFFALVNPDGSVNTQIDFGFKVRTNVMPPGSVQAVVPFSDIFDVVRNATTASGVRVYREVDKNTFTPGADVPLTDTNFPILSTISLYDVDAGGPF